MTMKSRLPHCAQWHTSNRSLRHAGVFQGIVPLHSFFTFFWCLTIFQEYGRVRRYSDQASSRRAPSPGTPATESYKLWKLVRMNIVICQLQSRSRLRVWTYPKLIIGQPWRRSRDIGQYPCPNVPFHKFACIRKKLLPTKYINLNLSKDMSQAAVEMITPLIMHPCIRIWFWSRYPYIT